MIEIKKNYTVKDLIKIYGPFWKKKLGLSSAPILKNKPEILNFEDFDIKIQNIYKRIYCFIINKNLNKNISLWAFGSRILGTWRTKEEAERLAKEYNVKIKYSDYDFATNAEILPSNKEIQDFLGENITIDGRKIEGLPIFKIVKIPKPHCSTE